MSHTKNNRKSDKSLYNENAENFIPLACHYDGNTLLTKNGELIQTLVISGMSADKVSNNLSNITPDVRAVLAKYFNRSDLACWVHTIRHKNNIDDTLKYENKFSADLHAKWAEKHKLHASFANIIYISVVIKSMGIYPNSLDDVVSSTSSNTISSNHDKYIEYCANTLYQITDSMMADLATHTLARQGVKMEGDRYISMPLYLYGHICNFSDEQVDITTFDLSKVLAVEKYAVGSRQIEVLHKGKQGFAAILTPKEYYHSNQEDLYADILQLSIEFVATEIFYPISKEEAQKPYTHQNYILGVTKDREICESKGIDIIMDPNRSDGFIMQQLSIMVVSSTLESLEHDTTRFSYALSNMGIVHVREDINLENIFWSQLPGNFNYLRKAIPSVVDNVGPFVTLQHAPHGRKFSRWGRYVTVMPSTLGTPYFMNFHSERKVGHTCFFGNVGSGKTTLMNFLISEATKYNPTIIYLSPDNSPKLFINALGGQWLDDPKIPVLEDDNHICAEILVDVLSGQYSDGLLPVEEKLLASLMDLIRKSGTYEGAISVIDNFDFTEPGRYLKAKILKMVKYLKTEKVVASKSSIIGINLSALQGPENYDLRAAFVITALRGMTIDKTTPKMLVLDEMADMLDHPYFTHNIGTCFQLAEMHNIALIGTVDTEKYVCASQKQLWETVDQNIDLKVVMPHENVNYDLMSIFGLTQVEKDSLGRTQYDSVFIMKPTGRRSIVIEFNGGGIETFIHLLSGNAKDLALMQQAKVNAGDKIEDWLPELYRLLEK